MVEENLSEPEPLAEPAPVEQSVETEKFDVDYSCLRCGTIVSNSELSRLPEIKCICGFRVFSKMRSPIVKSIKAL